MWRDRGRVSTMENITTTMNTQTQDFNKQEATQAGTDAAMTQPGQLKVATQISLLRILTENG